LRSYDRRERRMEHLTQIAAAGALLAVYYMYEYWYVTLSVLALGLVGMIFSFVAGDRK
jgi:hypothetical protein